MSGGGGYATFWLRKAFPAAAIARAAKCFTAALVAGCLAMPFATTGAAAAARTHSTDPMDWLIQHVCANAANQPIAVDPYGGCPAGSHERRLGLADPLPYFRHDQPGPNGNHPNGYQRHDSRPIVDVHTHRVVVANDMDFDYTAPYGMMHPGDGDGYDLYRVVNGYATGGGTRDGGGFSQTFFGPDCKPYGGWVFFPASFLRSLHPGASGRGIFPIRGRYWEQNGEAWPGLCEPDRGFSRDTLTTWRFVPDYPFGGHNGAPLKKIDAIVSTHGLPVRRGPSAHYHLERFYFTDLYGLTRWEAWVPSAEHVKPADTCGGATRMTYESASFTLAGCRDWSVVVLNDPPKPHFPWPYPVANLLRNWHFGAAGMTAWRRTGDNGEPGGRIVWRQQVSRAPDDLRLSQTHIGVRYLEIACSAAACDPHQAIYQDVPIGGLKPGSAYDYGFSGVVDGSRGSNRDGVIEVTLSERDHAGRELWHSSFEATVETNYRGKKPVDSVYNASLVFLATSPPAPFEPGAVSLRLALSPRDPVRYDILDAWLMAR
ncbi:MAG: hypothetical protein ACREE2_08555 [Stellaceae bacterium]